MNYWQLFAGITAFLYAISLMGDALKNMSGRSFKKYLQRQTSNKYRAILSGTLITALMQSSSVVVLMTLSFVGAGIIPMRNALAVVLGSNLGTTVNSWIIASLGFQVELNAFSYPLLTICLLRFILLPKNKYARMTADFLIGIAMLFIGLQWMREASAGMHIDPAGFASYSAYWFIGIGFIITIILQSSAATFALSLTALQSGALSMHTAACMVIGAELGTTIKIILGAMAGNRDQKQVAAANFSFNLITLLVAALLLDPMLYFIKDIAGLKDPFLSLAFFQSSLNILCILIFFPWLGSFSSFVERHFQSDSSDTRLRFLTEDIVIQNKELVQLAEKEVLHFLNESLDFNRLLISGQANGKKQSLRKRIFHPVSRQESYEKLKTLHGKLLNRLVEIKGAQAAGTLDTFDRLIASSRYFMVASKHIKDIQHDLDELRTSPNDVLFGILQKLRVEEEELTEDLRQSLNGYQDASHSVNGTQLLKWKELNDRRQAQANDEVYELLETHRIGQLNASTLLNMYRALHSSHEIIMKGLERLNYKGSPT